MIKKLLITAALAATLAGCGAEKKTVTDGVLPSDKQMEWQQMEYYMFVHFGPNTFSGVEWGDGKEHPEIFNPTDLDCRQWARTAKEAGMTGIIFTAKHHDGFCLWPSKFSTHTVRESSWRGGQGDVLREISDACREYGLKFGIYLSPWDMNHPKYGTAEYNEVFASMLTEVLTGYGPIFEVWLDGAVGEGVDANYDWDLFHSTIYAHQSDAVIFSDVGPGCRWIGNERGVAGETNWSRLTTEGFTPGRGAPAAEVLNTGQIDGTHWIPGEADVSIRSGWFFNSAAPEDVKSLDELTDIYFTSVGRNANLLLNVPPDTTGHIHVADSTRLMELHAAIDSMTAVNFAAGATVSLSGGEMTDGNETPDKDEAADGNTGATVEATVSADGATGATSSDGNTGATAEVASLPGGDAITDSDFGTFWQSSTAAPVSLTIDLGTPKSFNVLMLQEYIPLGQHIEQWSALYLHPETGEWMPLAEGTTVGYKRMLRFDEVTTGKIRIEIRKSLAAPAISSLALYKL